MNLKLIVLCVLLGSLTSCDQDNISKNNEPTDDTTSSEKLATTKPVMAKPSESDSVINQPIVKKVAEKPSEKVVELSWDDLIPKDALPDQDIVERYNNGEIEDNDPEMIALRKQIKELEEKAPVNKKLDGKKVKIPGYLVPVEMDGDKVKEFLLVPYQGACIHTPPPPTNQTIFVKTNPQSAKPFQTFDTVWVTGDMSVQKQSHELAESGFTINSANVVLYE